MDKYQLFTFPVTLDIAPDYLDCIEKPMSIQTLEVNVASFHYTTWEAFKVLFSYLEPL